MFHPHDTSEAAFPTYVKRDETSTKGLGLFIGGSHVTSSPRVSLHGHTASTSVSTSSTSSQWSRLHHRTSLLRLATGVTLPQGHHPAMLRARAQALPACHGAVLSLCQPSAPHPPRLTRPCHSSIQPPYSASRGCGGDTKLGGTHEI